MPIARLAELLQSQGYVRTDTVHDAGEFAVRGGIVDLYRRAANCRCASTSSATSWKPCAISTPPTSAAPGRARLHLLPASEALLDEESAEALWPLSRTVRRDGDRRSSVSGGQRRAAAGGHGALAPLFEEKLGTLFDHLPRNAVAT